MSSAGHPPPLVVRDDGRIREIGGSGPILGGWENSTWEDREVSVHADETLLMYTDGVTDTRGQTERFGAIRLRRLLAEHSGAPPAQLLFELQAALEAFQTEGHSDDTGAVALRPVPVESLAVAADGAPSGDDHVSPEVP
jgi:serine phosphatase RsbU (regulator of sigma subunit)